MAEIIAVYNQKGGVGKTTTATTLAYLLARDGFKVALIDLDEQGNSSIAYGVPNPEKLQTTILSLIAKIITDEPLPEPAEYMYNYNGVDLVPSNREISTLERNLCSVNFREYKLQEYIAHIADLYDYIIIDCMPAFNVALINVMVCADRVIIPVIPDLFASVGSIRFIENYLTLKAHANPKLEIAGILITMDQAHTTLSREVLADLNEAIGGHINIFETHIPRSVRVAKACAERKTICEYDPKNAAAIAYENFYKELMGR